MGGIIKYLIISFVILILSFNIYLNLNKETYFGDQQEKDFSKDNFKLYYFKGNGRGAIIRGLFSYAGVAFENILVEKEWAELKKNTTLFEFGQMPILVHNNKILSQSKPIYIYLARLFNIYGKTIDDQYQIDSLLSSYDDVLKTYLPVFFPKTEEEKNNPEKYKDIFAKELKRFFGVYEKRYEKLGKGKYFLGNYFSLADIYLTINMNVFSKVLGGMTFIKENAPNLGELITRIKNNELKVYFEKYHFN